MLAAMALVLGIDLGQPVPEPTLLRRYATLPPAAALVTPAQAAIGEWYEHSPPKLPTFFTGIEGQHLPTKATTCI